MKITKEELRQIINEELENVLAEQNLEQMFLAKGLDMKTVLGRKTPEQFMNIVKFSGKTLDQILDGIVSRQKSPKKRGLAGLRGAKPLKYVEKSDIVTASRG